jgi:hypothetical protein
VHFVAVGFEVARIHDPIVRYGADRVVIFEHTEEKDIYAAFVREVTARLKVSIKPLVIDHAKVDLFDFSNLMAELTSRMREETNLGNFVFVNVSGGSRLVDAAGLVASMMFGAHAYYVPVDEYFTKPKQFFRGSTPVGTAETVRPPVEIPPFELPPPRESLIRGLAVIDRLRKGKGVVRQTDLAQALHKSGLLENSPQGTSSSKMASLSESRRKIINPLKAGGWIEIRGHRRSARVEITALGDQMLLMFRNTFAGDL